MNWACAAAMVILLLTPGLAPAAENDKDTTNRAKLGEFVPSPKPSPAPAISLTDTAGNKVDLSGFGGKLVILNLWATWCEPCLREMPSLERLQSRLGDKVAVLSVSEDRGGTKIVEPFIAKLGLKSVKIYVDPKSEVGHVFTVQGLPTSLVIGRDGNLRGRVEGAAEWDSAKMLGVLEPLLSGEAVVKTSSH
jgi:thiol-disulfide isomerase/thioredoxin